MSENRNVGYAKGLRELADFLDAHPDLPEFNTPEISIHLWTRDSFLSAVRAMKSGEKDYSGDFFHLRKKFSGGVALNIQSERRTVCERIVVGEEEVEIFDPNAPKIKVKREKVEWRCDPLALLDAS